MMKPDDETLLNAYLDGELPATERIALEAVLRTNPTLTAELHELETVRRVVGRLARPTIPRDLGPVVLSQIEARRRRLDPGRVAFRVAGARASCPRSGARRCEPRDGFEAGASRRR